MLILLRIVVSDSKNFIQGTLATNLNHLIESKTIEVNAIVRLVKYAVNNIKNHRLVFVGEIGLDDVVKVPGRIGEPSNIDNSPSSTVTPAPSINASAPATFSATPTMTPTLSSTGVAKSVSSIPASIQPIAALSPYKDRSEIRARVTSKTDIKKWTNERGEGRLFSISLLDSSGEIRMAFFNDSVDQFFDLVQVGKVYDFANFQVKIAKRQFGAVQNDYELSADSNTTIKCVLEDAEDIPTIHYNFVPIANLASAKKDDIVDVIAVIKDAGEVSQITTKTTQKQLSKREMTVIDTSKASVRLTLWGKEAEEFNAPPSSVIAIKGARVNEYQGRTLSTMGTSLISYNPDISECHTLRGWFDSRGQDVSDVANVSSNSTAQSSSAYGSREDRKYLSQIKDENIGMGEKPDYFNVLATVTYIKSDTGNISYMACPTDGCNKKVIETGPSKYRCERCQKEFDRCDHRYIMTIQISDSTGAQWVQAFNETAAVLLQKSAEEMYHLKMNVRNHSIPTISHL